MRSSIVLALLALTIAVASAQVRVNGYARQDGTYVQPHYRSAPDSTPTNNYSYPGNVNPYTGAVAPQPAPAPLYPAPRAK